MFDIRQQLNFQQVDETMVPSEKVMTRSAIRFTWSR